MSETPANGAPAPQPRQMTVLIDPIPGLPALQMRNAGLDPDLHARVTVPIIGHQALPSSSPDRGLDLLVQCHLPNAVLPLVSSVIDPQTGRYRVIEAVAGMSVSFDVQRVHLTEASLEALARGDAREALLRMSWKICRRLWQRGNFEIADALEIFTGLDVDEEFIRARVAEWETPPEPDDEDTWDPPEATKE